MSQSKATRWRIRGSTAAPASAPPPTQASSRPSPRESSASGPTATTGRRAHSALAQIENSPARASTERVDREKRT